MAQRIFIARDQLLVSNLCRLLERAGISALTQKSAVDAPSGGSGPPAWRSELWVMKDRELARARLLLARTLAGEPSNSPRRAPAGAPAP